MFGEIVAFVLSLQYPMNRNYVKREEEKIKQERDNERKKGEKTIKKERRGERINK